MFQGNEVDQLFSILAQKFKNSEIRTYEELKEKITSSGIKPEPCIEEVEYIWDWKVFVLDRLTKEELRNHSHYHHFQIRKEGGDVKLRGKKYSFNDEFYPTSGIKVLQDSIDFEPVQVAPLRIEKLNLPKVYADLKRYIQTLPLDDRMTVQNSWDSLRIKLEELPMVVGSFQLMDLSILPKLAATNGLAFPENLRYLDDDDECNDLAGEIFPEGLEDSDFNEDLKVGLDVLIYSTVRRGRPWVGRIVSVESSSSFKIQWYQRSKKDRNLFTASQRSDGTPYVDSCECESVILWNFSTRIDEQSFIVSTFS